MRRVIYSGLAIFLFLQAFCQAADQNAAYKQANADVITAVHLRQQAELALKQPKSIETLAQARTLYIEAGKLFERAYYGYKSVSPDSKDAEQAKKAMEGCIQIVKEIQAHLSRS